MILGSAFLLGFFLLWVIYLFIFNWVILMEHQGQGEHSRTIPGWEELQSHLPQPLRVRNLQLLLWQWEGRGERSSSSISEIPDPAGAPSPGVSISSSWQSLSLGVLGRDSHQGQSRAGHKSPRAFCLCLQPRGSFTVNSQPWVLPSPEISVTES